MNTKLRQILITGKRSKGNSKSQFYINLAVVIGFIMFIFWVTFLYPKTFIDIKLVLLFLLLPGIILTPFIYKRILSICGYEAHIKNNRKYNAIIVSAVYFLVTVPIGNIIVTLLLFINYFFAQSEIQTISTTPFNIGENNSRDTHSSYTHIEIEWDNVKKRINVGNKSPESISDKFLKVKISKGLLGYYIIRGYRFYDSN